MPLQQALDLLRRTRDHYPWQHVVNTHVSAGADQRRVHSKPTRAGSPATRSFTDAAARWCALPPALSYFLPFFDAALPPPLGFLAPPLLPGSLRHRELLPARHRATPGSFECQRSQSTVIPSGSQTPRRMTSQTCCKRRWRSSCGTDILRDLDVVDFALSAIGPHLEDLAVLEVGESQSVCAG